MSAGDKGRRRDLIEQRLEHVVVAPVDERHVDVAAGKPLRGCEAAEAGADNHDVRAIARACMKCLSAPSSRRRRAGPCR